MDATGTTPSGLGYVYNLDASHLFWNVTCDMAVVNNTGARTFKVYFYDNTVTITIPPPGDVIDLYMSKMAKTDADNAAAQAAMDAQAAIDAAKQAALLNHLGPDWETFLGSIG